MILDFNYCLSHLDEVNSCVGEITAVNKKAWITGFQKKKKRKRNMTMCSKVFVNIIITK